MKIRVLILGLCLFLLGGNAAGQQDENIRQLVDSFHAVPVDIILSEIGKSDSVYRKTLAISRGIEYTRGIADALSILRLIEGYQGNIDLSTESTLQAITLYESLGEVKEAAYLYTELGYGMKSRDMESGLLYMRKGIAILQSEKDSMDLSSAYNNLGVMLVMDGNLDSSMVYVKKGLRFKRALKDSLGIPYSLNSLAGLYIQMDSMERVPPLLDESIALRKIAKNLNGLGENYATYGAYYAFLPDIDSAIHYFGKSAVIAKEINYTGLLAHNYLQMSELYKEKGDYEAALEHFTLAAQYQDSILNTEHLENIAALEVEFETEKNKAQLAEQSKELLKGKLRSRNLVLVGLVLASLLAFTLIYFYVRSKRLALKRKMEHIEFQRNLYAEKNRISRDLHDNIGSQVTFLISSMDNMAYKEDMDTSALKVLNQSAKQTLSQLRTTVWAIKSEDIDLGKFGERLEEYVDQARRMNDSVQLELAISGDALFPLSASESISIFRIVQEGVQNAMKYAKANTIRLDFRATAGKLTGVISDDGIGIQGENKAGQGMRFMEQRMEEIGGSLEVKSDGNGTALHLNLDRNKSNA